MQRAVNAAATARTDVERLVQELREVDELVRDNETKIDKFSHLMSLVTVQDEDAKRDTTTEPTIVHPKPAGDAGDDALVEATPTSPQGEAPSVRLGVDEDEASLVASAPVLSGHPMLHLHLSSPVELRRLLTSGAVFLKHGRRGTPHPRCV